MDEKIELLALEKPFAALSAEERLWVLSEMSQAEFEHLRSVLLTARQMDAEVLPSARLKTQLMARMHTPPVPTGLRRIALAKMPVWLAAAMLLLAVIWSIFPQKELVQATVITEIQHHTDTIWLEKTVWQTRVVVREKIVCPEKTNSSPLAVLPQTLHLPVIDSGQLRPEFSQPRVGSSLGDTPELMQFFTQGDR